jgi:hydrogenase/urease accessory protein HupE
MKTETGQFDRFAFALPWLCLLLVFLVLAAATAFAHDPGLSALELRFAGSELKAHLTFARSDLALLVPVEDRARLESLARETITISLDDRHLMADNATVSFDDSNGVHFHLNFPDAVGAKLQLRSALLTQLPAGHRQFLALRGNDDATLGGRLLDATNNLYELNLSEVAQLRAESQSFSRFLALGVEHILTGWDHLTFLLALLIVGASLREAAKIITSFTLAHSLTLSLSTLDVVSLSPFIVEPLIAASIIYVGLENLWRSEPKRRWLLTFAFGLLHGFGFATALKESGIGSGANAMLPLLAFNSGVELGQLAVATLALPLIHKLRAKSVFVTRGVPVCTTIIILAGGYWLIERTLFR